MVYMRYGFYELELKSGPEVDEERQSQMPPKQQTDHGCVTQTHQLQY